MRNVVATLMLLAATAVQGADIIKQGIVVQPLPGKAQVKVDMGPAEFGFFVVGREIRTWSTNEQDLHKGDVLYQVYKETETGHQVRVGQASRKKTNLPVIK